MVDRSRVIAACISVLATLGLGACQEVGEDDDAAEKAGAVSSAASSGPIVWANIGLATPESVFYDEDADEYIVSNINGHPLDVDNNGFLTRLRPDGTVKSLKWVEGGQNGVTLNGPKGMARIGRDLYVSDIDTVRVFDIRNGSPKAAYTIPGAQFLNDLAVRNGKVLVSDSALARDFSGAGGDAVYQISPCSGAIATIAKSTTLLSPNGLSAAGGKRWVVTFASNELYALDDAGNKTNVQALPNGGLDGIVQLKSGEMLISSWGASAIYRGTPGGTFVPVIENVAAPADIGYDSKRKRVLVPLFTTNEVHSYNVD